MLQQKVAKEEIRISKLGIRKITEGYIRSLQKAQTDPDVNEVQRSAIQKTIDDVILSDRELLGFVDVYEKTEYRAEMISRIIDILRYFREKRMISSTAIVEKIKQFQDTHQIIPTERKSVKETIEERRPTYHEMTLMSIAEYQKIRKEGVLAFFRNKNVNELYHSKIQAVVDNEIERLKIFKDEEAEYKKIQQQFDAGLVIALDSLHKLDPKVMYDGDYYLRMEQYNKLLKDIEQYGAQFLNEFLSYIKCHEVALKN